MNQILSFLLAGFGLIIGAIVVYNLLAHSDATIGILNAGTGFVTSETSLLEVR